MSKETVGTTNASLHTKNDAASRINLTNDKKKHAWRQVKIDSNEKSAKTYGLLLINDPPQSCCLDLGICKFLSQ